ncbi:MAG: site-specific integrase [Magnetococcus sp. YQC-3]
MPYRRTDSLVWWASYTDASGKRVRRTTGTTDRKEAVALEAKWKLGAFQEKQWDKEPERTFEELMLAYLKATQGTKRSAWLDKIHAAHLYRVFSGRDLTTLGAKDTRAYINYRQDQGISPATINRELTLLSSAINFARRELEWEIPNPVTGRKLREPEGRTRWITQDEAQRLIETAEKEPQSPHLPDFIRLALNTGCRSGELLRMEWNRVDFHARLIYLEAQHTKSKKRRSVPLNQAAYQVMVNRAKFRSENCPSSPWVFVHETGQRLQSVRTAFETACRKAGIENFHIHDLRHTCAAWLVTSGVALPEVRDLLGHSTIRMTERYAHLAPENIRAAVAVLDRGHVLVTVDNEEQKTASRSTS